MASNPLTFQSLRVPFVDPRTGLITRPWALFLQGLFATVGAGLGPSNAELQALITALDTSLDALTEEVGQLPPRQSFPENVSVDYNADAALLEQLRGIMAALARRIEDLEQAPL